MMLPAIPGVVLCLGAAVPVIVAAVVDVQTRRIPNELVALALISGLIVGLREGDVAGAMLGAIVVGLVAVLPWLVAPSAFGAGDVKLLVASGMIARIGQLPVLLFATTWLGALLAIALILAHRRRGITMPYGPAIAGGLLVTIIFE